ncbi:MAG: hypothetical protein K0B81_08085 [Candidatus Cloacimonetes bacterium]|nr:hypothetical protein [Candidatus Cloacimonadota bacterium]
MQMMTDKRFSISLTATIAELYELQKHYFAAYIAYWYLYKTENREEYKLKLSELKDKIFSSYELKYDPLMTEIFTEEELQRFGILPENLFSEFEKVIDNLQKNDQEELNGINSDEKKQFQGMSEEIGLEWKRLLEEEKAKERKKMESNPQLVLDQECWKQIKASDFLDFLSRLDIKDRSLDDITLPELIDSFIKNYVSDDNS